MLDKNFEINQPKPVARVEKRFRYIFEEGPLGMGIVNIDYKFVRINKAFTEIFGYLNDEPLSITDTFSPEYASDYLDSIGLVNSKTIPFYKVEGQFIRKNKEPFYGSLNFSPVYDEEGTLINYLFLIENITEKIIAQQELYKIYELQNSLNNILQVPSQHGSFIEQLELILATILISSKFHSWPSGLIFLTDSKDSGLLKLAVSIGMTNDVKLRCIQIKIGDCICGRCAKEKKIEFHTKKDCNTACFNEYMRDQNVAFYSVPIISRMRILGVLTIFIASENIDDSYVHNFLTAIGNILANIIERETAEAQINKSLEEKMVLLKEVHHRVKNNMQIISSLLYLQSKNVKDEYSMNLILDSQSRVKSMVLLHEALYQSGDLSGLRIKKYCDEMISNLFATFKTKSSYIKMTTDIEDIYLDMDTALSASLALNELISNSLKYAFIGKSEGEIFLSFHECGKDQFKIVLKDNGIGLPMDIDLNVTRSLGLQLVHDLIVIKLHGKIDIIRENGTTYNITIKRLNYKQRV